MSLFNGNLLFTLDLLSALLCVKVQCSSSLDLHPRLNRSFHFASRADNFFWVVQHKWVTFHLYCGLQHIIHQLHLTKPKRKWDVWQPNLISPKPWNRNPVSYLKWWTLILCFQHVTAARQSIPSQSKQFLPKCYYIMLPFSHKWV